MFFELGVCHWGALAAKVLVAVECFPRLVWNTIACDEGLLFRRCRLSR